MKRLLKLIPFINISGGKSYLLAIVLVILGLIGFVLLTNNRTSEQKPPNAKYDLPDWAANKPQNIEQIKDIRVALPYSGKYFTVIDGPEEDSLQVEYNPAISRDEARLLVENFMFENNIQQSLIYWKDGQTPQKEILKLGNIGA